MDDQKGSGLIVLAAAIIACIRLKGMDMKPSPKLTATITEAVQMAQMIVAHGGAQDVTNRNFVRIDVTVRV
jgi:malic enzyme